MATSIIFDGSISATIAVRGRSYTLVGSTNLAASSGGGSGSAGPVQLPDVKLAYHAPFDDALSLGTLDSTFNSTRGLIADIGTALNLPITFEDEWNQVQEQLKGFPAPLGDLYTEVLSQVELRITDIGLSLVAPGAGGGPYRSGSVTLGFGFDCSQANAALLGIRLQAIGVKFSVGVSVS